MVVRHSSAGELALALDHMGGQGGPAVGARAATATVSYRPSDARIRLAMQGCRVLTSTLLQVVQGSSLALG